MSVINSQPLIGASGQAGYFLDRSLRFRQSASPSLTRTPSVSGSQTTFTHSIWLKRGLLSSNNYLTIYGSESSGSNYVNCAFLSDTLYWTTFNGTTNITIQTTQVFRDVSSWYHLVIAVDTTQATASNRVKLYINGSQITAGTFNYPTQNQALQINTSSFTHKLGFSLGFGQYFDGYMAEVNFIDGQALTPSSFGETSASTGVWIPKKYTGTYGTNGFYLDFKDNSALTTSSNAGLGKDNSGNGNYLVTNNISITSDATYDSMTDVPTLTSATAANYAVLNPLDKGGNITLSAANLNYSTGATNMVRATMQIPSTGKWYWECTQTSSNSEQFGIATASASTGTYLGGDANGWSYGGSGSKFNNNSSSAYGASFTNGDVIGVAFDADAGTLTFYKNNVSQGTAFSSLTGTYFPAVGGNLSSGVINFGQRPFAYTPPSGFVALNTFNLPTPTIGATASSQANDYFDATTYTATGTTQAVVNSGGMQPDFVWIKPRSIVATNLLFDSIRGVTKYLESNSTNAETTDTTNFFNSFNSNGFSQGTGNYANGTTVVAWQWRANGTGVTNTDGTITATVSANTTAGFSIATGTTLASGTLSIGHGLGVSPAMVIYRSKSSGQNWWVWHKSLPNAATGRALRLNTTDSEVNGAYFGTISSTIVTVSGAALNSDPFVLYSFSEVAGYSRFGSYTGNGSTDGVFVFCGFRPRYIMVKRTDSTSGWTIFDTSRDTFNITSKEIYANASDAEASGNNLDILSNGFKCRTTNSWINASGGTYIFMALAENPFKYSVAR